MPFQGEEIECVVCGAKQRSDPVRETNWRAVEVNERRYYACAAEFPADGASAEKFSQAYERVIREVLRHV
jgi:hypothetical protein